MRIPSLPLPPAFVFLLFLYFTPALSFCINIHCGVQNNKSANIDRRINTLHATNKNFYDNLWDNNDAEDDDDEDDDINQPYRNRSLAWTKRYRKLNPYEQCRQRVLQFGHRSKEDWDEAMESGQLGSYVPSHPDKMYAYEWVSWDEWLGLMRSYEETRQLAISVLGCKSLDDYILFVRSNPKRGEGLRIPVRPDLFFGEKWKSEEDFFKRPLDLGNKE